MNYGYGRITCRKGDYIWGLSSDFTLVWRNDEIQVVRCYGCEGLENVEDKTDTDGELTEPEVLDLAESSGLIFSSNEFEGEYRVTDTNKLGCCGCSAFCDSAEEAATLQKDYRSGCVSLSDKLSVRVYKYVHVCDRGYYVHDDSFDFM